MRVPPTATILPHSVPAPEEARLPTNVVTLQPAVRAWQTGMPLSAQLVWQPAQAVPASPEDRPQQPIASVRALPLSAPPSAMPTAMSVDDEDSRLSRQTTALFQESSFSRQATAISHDEVSTIRNFCGQSTAASSASWEAACDSRLSSKTTAIHDSRLSSKATAMSVDDEDSPSSRQAAAISQDEVHAIRDFRPHSMAASSAAWEAASKERQEPPDWLHSSNGPGDADRGGAARRASVQLPALSRELGSRNTFIDISEGGSPLDLRRVKSSPAFSPSCCESESDESEGQH